ncbi:MAG: sigma-70 family RNA polymerase sigma factor [Planctomycetaceae bacterium]|nr:sigma-70 family RNA polymerase sigma factor [Planctomycetaceae bacterium]
MDTSIPPSDDSPTDDSPTLNDRDLLRRFVQDADEAAFAEIVNRYQGLVLGVTRRIVGNQADMDDAFQATFLALARRPRSIRKASSLSSWLYSVAWRTSWRLVKQRRKLPVESLAAQPADNDDDPLDRIAAAQDCTVLDEELNSLPQDYRDVLVMTYFADQTSQQIADQFNVSKGTIDGRIRQARNMLRVRLARRGVAIGVLTLAAGMNSATTAQASSALLQQTIQLGSQTLTGSLPETTNLSHLDPLIQSEAAMLSSKAILSGVAVIAMAAGALALQVNGDTQADSPEVPTLNNVLPTEDQPLPESDPNAVLVSMPVNDEKDESATADKRANETDKPVYANAVEPRTLNRGEVTVIQHSERIQRVEDFDAGIVSVTVVPNAPDKLKVSGLKSGSTVLNITGESGLLVLYSVTVAADPDVVVASGGAGGQETPTIRITAYPSDAKPVEKWMYELLEKPVPDLDFVEGMLLSEVLEYLATHFNKQESGDEGFRLDFFIDRKELKAIGLPNLNDAYVSDVDLNGVSLQNALKLILEQTEQSELTYVIKDEVMMITSREKAESEKMLTTRLYPVGHLLHLDYSSFSFPEQAPVGGMGGGGGFFSVPDPQFGGGGFGGGGFGGGSSSPEQGATPKDVARLKTLESLIMEMTSPPLTWYETDASGGAIRRAGDNLVIRQTFQGHQEIVRLLNLLSEAAGRG